jgi:tetratricopeptide (TPR) repeat protein
MLRQLLQPVLRRRRGVAVALWGEPGIGRSHAAARLLAELPCRSASVAATAPLAALAGLLPRPGRLAGWASATLARLRAGAPVEPARALEAVAAALVASSPFVLHVEDLHEAGDERAGFLRELAATVRRTPGVGLLATSRTDPGAPFERVRAEPLSRHEVHELLVAALGADPPAEAAAWIADRSGGNPLFALEYLRYLGRQGHLWSDGRSWHWRRPGPDAPPPTVEALIEHFLAGALVGDDIAAVAAARALLPAGADDELGALAAGLEPAAWRSADRELARRGVVANGAFVHPLYREAAARLVPAARRREVARRALAAPDLAPAHVAALVSDAELEAREAVDLLRRTAAAARAGGDDATAGRLLASASERATGEESGALALEAAGLLAGRDYPLMLALAERAARLLEDPTEALLLQAAGLSVRGDHGAMRRVLAGLPAEAKRGAAWLERQVRLLHQAGLREELISAWEASPHRDECGGGTVHFVGWAYLHAGRPRVAAALVDQWLARPTTDEEGAADLKELRASIAFYLGDHAAAETTFTELLERAAARGGVTPPNVANLLRNRAVARMQQARVAESLQDLQAALRVYEEVGHGLHYAGTLVMMSYAYQDMGAYERAEEVLTEALEVVQRAGDARFVNGVAAQLADLYLEWPGWAHPALALRYAAQAAETAPPEGLESVTAAYLLSRARTATGRAAEGLELAERALAMSRAAELAEAELASRFALGLALEALGRPAEARETFETASARAARLGLPLHAHRYGLEVDRLAGDRESAARRESWFAERGLGHGVNLVRRYFPPPDEGAGARPPQGAASLRLEVLGPMRLRRADGTAPVRGARRRALLLALVEARLAGQTEAGRLALVEALYPHGDEPRAMASLKQLVSDLRRDLGASAIVTTAAGYALGDVATDVEEFLATGDTSLWRGELGEGADWQVRESVLRRLQVALAAAAEARLGTDPAEAARSAGLLRRLDPYDAGTLRLHLRALAAAGLRRTLAEEYERARSLFAEVGEALPAGPAELLEPATE